MSLGRVLIGYARLGKWVGLELDDLLITHTAPIDPNQSDVRILDLGCGDGQWAIDMAT